MATFSGSIFNGASGRFGNAIVYVMNKIQVLRAAPTKFRKSKPSYLQQCNREAFVIKHALAKSLKKELINRIWKKMEYIGGDNPYNRFIKKISPAFGRTDHFIFPELMVISEGELLPAGGFKATKDENNLMFSWEKGTRTKKCFPFDSLNIVAITSPNSLKVLDVNASRDELCASIPISDLPAEINEGYVFWSTSEDKMFSPSMYWKCG